MSLRALGVALACCSSGVTFAFAAAPQQVDVPAGPLAEGIDALARQTGVYVIYPSEAVRGLRTHGVSGTLEAEEAFRRLIVGTPLVLKEQAGSLVITVPSASAGSQGSARSDKEGGNTASREFLLAQENSAASAPTPAVVKSNPDAASSITGATVEEVIVTAQKRAERVIDVPISIAALSGEELEQRHITTIDDLSFVVPGLQTTRGGLAHFIDLRGISNGNGNLPLVGLYLDEADVTSTGTGQLDIDTYDLQRVEVLRGPQGTLYGEGSVGGTIRFITNDPVLDRFQMNADVAALFTQTGTPSQRIQSVVNVPLLDTLAVRVAGQFESNGGWIDMPAAGLTDVNHQTLADARAKVLWRPTAQLAAVATTEIHRNKGGENAFEAVKGEYTAPFGLATPRQVRLDYNLYNLTLTYDLAGAKLLNTTTYFDQLNAEYDYGHFYVFAPPPTLPYGIYSPSYYLTGRTLNDELRLTSTGDGPWQWTLGTFYHRHDRTLAYSDFYFAAEGPLPATRYPGDETQNSYRDWSVFGDTSYRLWDRLTIGAGLRGYRDDQRAVDVTGSVFQSGSFHSVDPRLYATLKVSRGVNLYASAAKGFRSGGFNSRAGQPTYDPESVWTYELGIKTDLPGNRLRLDADVFYSNYSNYVVFTNPPPFSGAYANNGGRARIKGIEAAGSWQPADHWTVSVSADYIDAYILSIIGDPVTAPLARGDKLPNVPKYQGTASMQRDFSWGGHVGFVRLDYSLKGRSVVGSPEKTVNSPFSQSDVINLLNLSANLVCNENLSLQVFAQNLLNDRGFSDADVPDQTAERPRPRTYGVGFAVRF